MEFRTRQSELGVELFQRSERCRLPSVVLVPVHVKNLLAGNGQKAGQDAFSKAGAQDDAVVFLIHGERSRFITS